MKKRNEGYTLVYVLVVLVVLCLVASAVLSSAIRNLQFQKKAAASMADKYTVQGDIARIRLQLEGMNDSGTIDLNSCPGCQIVVVDNVIVIRANSGRIQGDCVLVLKAAAGKNLIFQDADQTGLCDGIYAIDKLGGVECVHYEIYTVEEVAADGVQPEDYIPNPDDIQNEQGSGTE